MQIPVAVNTVLVTVCQALRLWKLHCLPAFLALARLAITPVTKSTPIKTKAINIRDLTGTSRLRKLQAPALKYWYTLSNDFCYFVYGKLCKVSVGIIIKEPA